MKVTQKDKNYEFIIEGAISEKTEIFETKMADALTIMVDFDKLTYINSIGVKNWITWNLQIPASTKMTLKNCSSLIMNQINTVHGFLPVQAKVESIKAPYVCDGCGSELVKLIALGTDYDYAPPGGKRTVNLPETIPCAKCKKDMEMDFMEEKFFGFLGKK